MSASGKKDHRRKSLGGQILFCLTLPFGVLFMLGDLLASPFEKIRHNNLVCWLIWTLLRYSVPVAILVISIKYLSAHFRKLRF